MHTSFKNMIIDEFTLSFQEFITRQETRISRCDEFQESNEIGV